MFLSLFALLFGFGVVLDRSSQVQAVVITAPTAGEDVDLAKPFVIKWTIERCGNSRRYTLVASSTTGMSKHKLI